jgi:hypothetical protein
MRYNQKYVEFNEFKNNDKKIEIKYMKDRYIYFDFGMWFEDQYKPYLGVLKKCLAIIGNGENFIKLEKWFENRFDMNFFEFLKSVFTNDELSYIRFKRDVGVKELLRFGSKGLKDIVEQSGMSIKELFEGKKIAKVDIVNYDKPSVYAGKNNY